MWALLGPWGLAPSRLVAVAAPCIGFLQVAVAPTCLPLLCCAATGLVAVPARPRPVALPRLWVHIVCRFLSVVHGVRRQRGVSVALGRSPRTSHLLRFIVPPFPRVSFGLGPPDVVRQPPSRQVHVQFPDLEPCLQAFCRACLPLLTFVGCWLDPAVPVLLLHSLPCLVQGSGFCCAKTPPAFSPFSCSYL